MPDTVFPYDDEVVDPYGDDDTKNPHETTGDEAPATEASPRKAGRPRKATKKT